MSSVLQLSNEQSVLSWVFFACFLSSSRRMSPPSKNYFTRESRVAPYTVVIHRLNDVSSYSLQRKKREWVFFFIWTQCVYDHIPVERGEKGKVFPGPRDVWGPAVVQKYKVHQDVPLKKQNLKFFSSSRRASRECFPPAPLWLSTSLYNQNQTDRQTTCRDNSPPSTCAHRVLIGRNNKKTKQ